VASSQPEHPRTDNYCKWIDHEKGDEMIPQDPVMLLSFINMKLRDEYGSLDALAEGLDISSDEMEAIVTKLRDLGYEYKAEFNKFA
jgi:biotin operon repressor